MPTDLDELERLMREALDAPWVSDDGILSSDTRVICNEPPYIRGGNCVMVADNLRDEDGDFIAALRNAAPELIRNARRYQELLFAVETKCSDETRHETALRYIKQAENRPIGEGQSAAIARQEGEG